MTDNSDLPSRLAAAAKGSRALDAVILNLDRDGGWDHENTTGWPDMATFQVLREAKNAGLVERSSAYGNLCWRLSEDGVAYAATLRARATKEANDG